MRHRAPRNLLTLLRLRRLRPRRRATEGTAGTAALARPGLRLGLAVASTLALLTGGMVAASQLGRTEVPTGGGETYADRRGAAEPSRSSGRTAWPTFDTGTPSGRPPSHPEAAPTPVDSPDAPERESTPSPDAGERRAADRSPLDLPSARVSVSAEVPDVPTPTAPTGESSGSPRATSDDTRQDPTATPPRDDTPPQTTIVSGPTATNGSALEEDSEFVFDADESATFSCSLDGQPFRPCDSPQEYDDLAPGRHEFAVRAIDDAGNVDPTPDEHSWVTTGSGLDPDGLPG